MLVASTAPAGRTGRPGRSALLALVLTLLLSLGTVLAAGAPVVADEAREAEVLRLLQDERANLGRDRLATSAALSRIAREQARRMAFAQDLHHTPDLRRAVDDVLDDWLGAGENVGRGRDVAVVHQAFLESTAHRDNLLAERWTHVGVGVVATQGRVWIVQAFAEIPGSAKLAPAVQRLAGADRVETAAEVARAAYEPGTTGHVVLVDGRDPHAALAAAPLAGGLDGPLLLTSPDGLDPAASAATAAALGGGGTAWLVGQLGDRVAADVRALGAEVVRLRAGDAGLTAAAIARVVPGRPATAFLATDRDVADALAAASVAAVTGWPVLFTDPAFLSPATAGVLAELGIAEVVVVGGPAAVADDVLAALSARGHAVRRVAGADRVETAARVADLGLSLGLSPTNPTIATGWAHPDALAGSTLTAVRRGPMLLTHGDRLSPVTAGWLERHAAAVELVTVLGGPAAVDEGVRVAVERLLG